jgi:uncharacterized tellurite resistance protein B-like protein
MLFEGDPGVQKVAHDSALTAELLLLFRVALADGNVEKSELETLRNIADQAFGIDPESFGKVVNYLHDFGYEVTGRQAAELFRKMPYERKKDLIEHMTAVATADHNLDDREVGLIRRTIALLNEDDQA